MSAEHTYNNTTDKNKRLSLPTITYIRGKCQCGGGGLVINVDISYDTLYGSA